jgi:hypothetical protein
MKNRVNISKLIEEKYKDKDDTFSFKQLNEMIDSVLDESYQYNTKLGDPGNLEENPQSVNIHQRMYGAQGARNERPDEPGYGSNVDNLPQVRPTTVAENNPSSSDGRPQKVELDIPDIFSLVTNSKQTLHSEDRKLINDIVENMLAGQELKRADGSSRRANWIDRVNSFNRVAQNYVGQIQEFEGGIRSAISNLIYLNVFRKLSFNVAQPGKLFEYVMAPLIDPTATVEGETDTGIVDIRKRTGAAGGGASSYSLKFFKGDEITINGSRGGLLEYSQQYKNALTYIIASVDESKGIIQFGEFLVSTNLEHFRDFNQSAKEFADGAIFTGSGKQGMLFGVWVPPKKGQTLADAVAEQGQGSQIKPGQQASGKGGKVSHSIAGADIGVYNKKNEFLEVLNFIKKNGTNIFSSKISPLRVPLFPQWKELFAKGILKQEDKQVIINKIIETFTEINKIIANALEVTSDLTTPVYEKLTTPAIPNKLAELSNFVNELVKKNTEQSQQQPTSLKEAQEGENNFSISVASVWGYIQTPISINLGNPTEYEKLQLKIASSLTQHVQTTLKNYKELNTNIVGFFAVDPSKPSVKKGQSGPADYGNKAIENAKNIADGIDSFMKQEKNPGTQLSMFEEE